MIFNKDALKITEQFNIKLNDSILIKLEDAVKTKKELLLTVAASHYGLLNGNGVIYRHDTVKNNIISYVHPTPKPLIMNHRPKESKKFGRVVAADYKETSNYNIISSLKDTEGLSTLEYLNLCKDTIIPYQFKNKLYDGLGFCELTAIVDDKDGIEKVLSKEFLSVSIGANPVRLICSNCLQDQTIKLCDHYSHKNNGIFMLAEELEYEELSFVKKPADPFGKVTRIHDGKIEEVEYELETSWLDANIDAIYAEDFFNIKLNDSTKTIVCVDNICKIVNREEEMAKKQDDQTPVINIQYAQEFDAEKLSALKLTDSEDQEVSELLQLTDEEIAELKDSSFAVIQKTEEGTKRRFPIVNESQVKAAYSLLDSASDLTEAEVKKAKAVIDKAAKKLGIELEDSSKENISTGETKTSIEQLMDAAKAEIEAFDPTKLEDEDKKPTPIAMIFSWLQGLGTSLKWAGDDLHSSIGYYLKSLGQEVVDKGHYDSLNDQVKSLADELTEAKEEVQLLDELNRDLNVQIRKSLVDEIVDCKQVLGVLTDSIEDEKVKLIKYPYDILVSQVAEYRGLKSKMTDSSFNNKKQDIKTVEDPTLQDSDNGNDDPPAKLEDDQKELSQAELKRLFVSLFRK